MTEEIFGLTETGELINNETGRVYCVKGISALDLQDILNRLIKENKELKQFKQLVFDLIDRKINEMEKKYKFGQEVYKGCPMHNIRYGINTLKELRKELEE